MSASSSPSADAKKLPAAAPKSTAQWKRFQRKRHGLSGWRRGRLAGQPGPVQEAWTGRLHFTNGSASDGVLGAQLAAALAQWQTPRNGELCPLQTCWCADMLTLLR